MAPSSDRTEPDTRRKRPGRVPRVEEAISNPGAVKINVTGAFIVDDDDRSRSPVEADGVHYENKDIRLPHHTGVVSHVAVDVSLSFCLPRTATDTPQSAKVCEDGSTDHNCYLDRRITREARLLYSGARRGGQWRSPELYQLRNPPD